MTLPASLRALAHRSFRMYFFGQAVSILGTWIQQVAMSWLVYRLTGSAALLGLTAFAAMVPMLLVGPLAGAWVDRQDRRRVLLWVQALMFLLAATLATLTWLEWIGPAVLILMAALLGVLNAFDTPARQTLIGSVLPDRADLPNALALNAMLFNAARFVGPLLASALLGALPAERAEAVCFSLNALSYLGLFLGVRAIPDMASERATGSVGHVFREGLRYARESWAMRTLIIALAFFNLATAAYSVLLPVLAKDVFAGDASTLGVLWAAAGGGGLAGTIFLAHQRGLRQVMNGIVVGVVLCVVAMLALALAPHLWLAMAALAVLGFGQSIANIGTNTLMQNMAPDHLRGRIVSFFSSTRFGFDAIGGLIAGSLAVLLSARWTLAGEGIVLAGLSAWLLLRAGRLRRAM